MSHVKSLVLVVGVALAVAFGSVAYSFAATPHAPSGADHIGSSPTYAVTFGETGLAYGTNWGVSVQSQGESSGDFQHVETSSSSTLQFELPNGTYHYEVHSILGFAISGNLSEGNFTVDGGSPATISVAFVPLPSYSVTFTETGLAAGTTWTVTVFASEEGGSDWGGSESGYVTESSNTTTMVFSLPNGTYGYHVHSEAGYDVSGNGSFGSFSVSGAAVTNLSVQFSPIVTYPVTFRETGLANGTTWTVTVIGALGDNGSWGSDDGYVTQSSNTTAIVFALPNGTYAFYVHGVVGYEVSENSSHGVFNISGAAALSISVRFFVPPTYAVMFQEAGLASGTNWSVTVAAIGMDGGSTPPEDGGYMTESSNTSTIVFHLQNGTYGYFVHPVEGYTLPDNATYGSFAVAGASPSPIAVPFSKIMTYSATFTESGLASGTQWTVTVASNSWGGDWGGGEGYYETLSSNTSTIVFAVPNGTYGYYVHGVVGYQLSANSSAYGTFNVSGASPPTVGVSFVPVVSYSVTFSESGLANGTNWSVTVVSSGEGMGEWGSGSLVTASSTTTTITLSLPNGTYAFYVHPVEGYYTNASSGTFTVSGSAIASILVDFSASMSSAISVATAAMPTVRA